LQAAAKNPAPRCNTAPPRATTRCASSWPPSWPARAQGPAPDGLIVTTGSQQALDLLGKTLINPGDKVIVEGPTFLATIQCFRLYGAELISAPIDGHGVQTDQLES
jgi:DNA-binding transcriptional MocR family regulator